MIGNYKAVVLQRLPEAGNHCQIFTGYLSDSRVCLFERIIKRSSGISKSARQFSLS
ncbi:hypothetical protein CANARDRAFT_74536 [[Candida] arabinofermentans NRRL YB-2248]|uniref:Uncharacterized protein n=1 Tax=[Candida] arabinofermentans NRRL YB-2248 TaxID=983967 RepID=A0A1E4SW10_9ASCO|nr:hypothetical protein CANARDRAFT_74536 [[Candida] arabinofermentans NRRL YB-2248]